MTKAILDLCKWPTPAFQSLLKVFEKFENYETKDIEEIQKATVHLNQRRLSRGHTMTMPNKLIVLLSCMDPELFLGESVEILNNRSQSQYR